MNARVNASAGFSAAILQQFATVQVESSPVEFGEKTMFLLKRFPGNPDIEKARAEFERAQEVEQRFVKDFEGVDFTER